jgi:hypothetical protein
MGIQGEAGLQDISRNMFNGGEWGKTGQCNICNIGYNNLTAHQSICINYRLDMLRVVSSTVSCAAVNYTRHHYFVISVKFFVIPRRFCVDVKTSFVRYVTIVIMKV